MKENTKKVIKTIKKIYTMYCYAITAYNCIKSRGFRKLNDKGLLINALELLIDDCSSEYGLVDIYKEMEVYFNPYFMMLVCKPGSIAFVNKYTNKCVVDNTFMNMTYETRYFILSHEYRHTLQDVNIIDGLICALTRCLYILIGKVHPLELDADKYALEICGKENSINALKEIMKANKLNFISNLEIKRRIKYINQ